jgi:protoporphyrinogen oxidase
MNKDKIFIIGAGVSGLVAALELEKGGFSPIILEGTDRIGGRIKTDIADGFLLDHGFQVLLTAYPEAQKYLDYEKLDLRIFDPGAVILKPGFLMTIHDPLRNPTRLIPMLFSPIGTFRDKLLIAWLTTKLKKQSIEEIFVEQDSTTHEFLKSYGFSNKIIDNFFKPFFRGIFLEEGLTTSSRMFKFVFKMFSTGHAAVPKRGMQAIPDHLFNQLKSTEIRLNQKVKAIEGSQIILDSGEILEADQIIIASNPNALIKEKSNIVKGFKKVINIYFELEKSFLAAPMIGLVPGEQFYINNLVFMTDVNSAYSESAKALLSVSVVKPTRDLNNLVQMVTIELEALTGIQSTHFKPIRTYEIDYALPEIDHLKNEVSNIPVKVGQNIYLAGDYMLNASINGAMASGRKAAEALMMTLKS